MLETAEGRGVRADFRCVSSAEGERYAWEQQLEGTPFANAPAQLEGRDRPPRRGRGDRGRLTSEQTLRGLSRFGSPMMRGGQGRILDEALAGLERALEPGPNERRASPRLEVVGVGRPRGRARARCRGAGTLQEWVGELEPWPLATEIEGFEIPAAEPLPQALIDAVGAERVFTSKEDRVRHATGCGYADLARLRRGASRRRPTRPCCRPTPTRSPG